MKEQPVAVAIDGPSGAGKSSVARAAAGRLGFVYVDTGAIYRTVGLAVRRAGLDPGEAGGVAALLPSLHIELSYDSTGAQAMLLDGEDVSAAIRAPEISMCASSVAALPVNGLILLTTGLARVKIRDAYAPMFMQSVFMTLIGTFLCAIILTIAPGLA